MFAGVVFDVGLIGICGVLSFLTARRTGEIDIRLARGTQRSPMRREPLSALRHD
jgi:hypothetical protein